MPRGNPYVWKKHGQSYAELAGTTTAVERAQEIAPRRLPAVTPAMVAELRSTNPAGMPATTLPRGAGSFVMQARWSFGVPRAASAHGASGASALAAAATTTTTTPGGIMALSSPGGPVLAPAVALTGKDRSSGASTSDLPPRTYATETKTNYLPPPADFRRTRSAGPLPCTFPTPNQPNDWRTTKQQDFRWENHTNSTRTQAFRLKDTDRLLPQDVPHDAPTATTSQRAHFYRRSFREAQSINPSGCKATQPGGYNIITGAATTYVNNAFEHWDGRDYRRHR